MHRGGKGLTVVPPSCLQLDRSSLDSLNTRLRAKMEEIRVEAAAADKDAADKDAAAAAAAAPMTLKAFYRDYCEPPAYGIYTGKKLLLSG